MSSETETTGWAGLLRYYPADVAVATVVTVGCWFAVRALPIGSELRPLVAVPFLVVLPGYALLSVLFPAAARSAAAGATDRPRGLDFVERAGLTIAVSIPLLIAIAVALPLGGRGLEAAPAIDALGAVTVALLQLAALRRGLIGPDGQFTVAPRAAFDRLVGTGSGRSPISAIVLLGAIALASGVLLFAIVAPPAAGSYTELAIYGEAENGTDEIGAIPTAIEPGTSVDARVEVSNQHGDRRSYVAIVQQQTLEGETVRDRTRLGTIEYDLASGESNRRDVDITPTAPLDQPVRVAVLLYDTAAGPVPDAPTMDNADRTLYFWITVTEDPSDDRTTVGE
ncbi:DUF1616 domain-containing protein [Halovivax limisalsi]|uniref:DUF1616 domain-containing protein n=1 Tax=Halovivax limisalsi TaxID=1453760 RepID=UPI001FFC9B4F|nr:DUF1616 domain-containing protein [Halovivax limisalsi]